MCPLPVLSKNDFLLPHVTPFTSNTPTQLSSIAPFPKHHSPQKMLKNATKQKNINMSKEIHLISFFTYTKNPEANQPTGPSHRFLSPPTCAAIKIAEPRASRF